MSRNTLSRWSETKHENTKKSRERTSAILLQELFFALREAKFCIVHVLNSRFSYWIWSNWNWNFYFVIWPLDGVYRGSFHISKRNGYWSEKIHKFWKNSENYQKYCWEMFRCILFSQIFCKSFLLLFICISTFLWNLQFLMLQEHSFRK